MSFYSEMAADADLLIGEFGQAVTITPQTAGSYDPATGAASVTATPTQSGTGVEEAYKAHQIDGTLVKAGDIRLMLSPLNAAGAALTAPDVNQRVTLADTTVWTIISVERIAPAGTVLMYVLQLRRG
jgi:hypothetical protein